ncbi:pilus assembly FimT family protein [Aquipseudomonas alcaligenes]|jgi:MSHA pilin protein MshC|uniref:Type II secretion system GspH family protein n=1 Tax=Aquipseudomonas alcaligenes TaxID=43263 RepID=A0AA42MYL6_AQUAC|nr:type II secretion system protein [Pseudomonas alcaligenes]MDH1054161.1 type II secretion system GspH family protein [Pseudomonas alcaligenes]
MQRGFTMVELIMVIVILGILAAVVGPRFFDRQVFDERLYFEQSLSAVRYAQKLALSSGCPVRAQVGAAGYALSYAAACGGLVDGSPVANPVGGGDYAQAAPAGVAIDPRLDIVFNSLGCLSASAACPDGAAAQTAGIGGFTFRVHAATGFIESLP